MNIQVQTPSNRLSSLQALGRYGHPSPAGENDSPAITDSVTLGSSFSSEFNMADAIKFGAVGVVPGLGAVSNFVIGAITGLAGQHSQSKAASLGTVANLLGTGALIAGLAISSSSTTLAGVGLLIGSGVAGAYSAGGDN